MVAMKAIALGAVLILAAAAFVLIPGSNPVAQGVAKGLPPLVEPLPSSAEALPAGFKPLYTPAVAGPVSAATSTGEYTEVLWAGTTPLSTFPEVTVLVNVSSAEGEYCGYLDLPGNILERFEIYEGNTRRAVSSVECAADATAGVDIVVVFDDTGSMYNQITTLKNSVRTFADKLVSEMEGSGYEPAFGLITFKDSAQIRRPLTTNVTAFESAVNNLTASGGSGFAGSIDAVCTAATDISWRAGAMHVILLATDVVSWYRGDESGIPAKHTINEALSLLAAQDITVYSLTPTFENDWYSSYYLKPQNDPREIAIGSGGYTIDIATDDIASALGLITAQVLPHYEIKFIAEDPDEISPAIRVKHDSTAGQSADGRTWSRAFSEIQPAIDAAYALLTTGTITRQIELRTVDPALAPDTAVVSYSTLLSDPLSGGNVEVWVAGGVYDEPRTDMVTTEGIFQTYNTGAIVMKPGIVLKGGFQGTDANDAVQNPQLYPVIIDGSKARAVTDRSGVTEYQPAYHVMRVAPIGAHTVEASIEDCTLRGGSGGVRFQSGGTDASDYGGGLLVDGLAVAIEDCTFTGNYSHFGGGIALRHAPPCSITNSTVTGNSAYSGGGMYCLKASPTITNVAFTNNEAVTGGGIECVGLYEYEDPFTGAKSSPVFYDGEISQNTASVYGGGAVLFSCLASFTTVDFRDNTGAVDGGALFANKSRLSIVEGDFSDNAVIGDGGAFCLRESRVNISRAAFTGNTAGGNSGAIAFQDCRDADSAITSCDFADNSAGGVAGALGVNIARVNVAQSSFQRNSAKNHGGAIYFGGEYSSGDFVNLLIAENSAQTGTGGALYVDGNYSNSTITIRNCTVASNTTAEKGGGLWYTGRMTMNIFNTIFWNNTGERGVTVTDSQYPPSVTYCILQQTQDLFGSTNLAIDPMFSTSPASAYRLLAGSPAIDAGQSTGAPSVDRNGAARPQGNGVEIGAFEGAVSPGPPQASEIEVPIATVEPATLDLGNVALGEQASATFVITNSGGGILSGEAAAPAPFQIDSGADYALASKQSQTVTVTFSPTVIGVHAANIAVDGAIVAVSARAYRPATTPGTGGQDTGPPAGPVAVFADLHLERAVRTAAGKPSGVLYVSDLAELTVLDASSAGISSLDGIGQCSALQEVYLAQNTIADLSPLSALSGLTRLNIAYNRVVNLAPIDDLPLLANLNLSANRVSDLAPVLNMASMRNGACVYAKGNALSDTSLCSVIPELAARGVTVEHDGECPNAGDPPGDDGPDGNPGTPPPADDGNDDVPDVPRATPAGCAGGQGSTHAVWGDMALLAIALTALCMYRVRGSQSA